MKEYLKILMLEDSTDDAEIIQRFLLDKKFDCEFRLAIDKETYLLALDQFHPDIILADHSLPQFNSMDALAIARQRYPEIPFIIVTGTVSEEFAANIIKLGADDYILKDRLAKLSSAIITTIERRKSEKEKREVAEKLSASEMRYRRLFEAAKDGILILNADTGLIEDVNPFLIDMLGYSHLEFLGKQLWEIGLFKDIVQNKSAFETLKKERYIRYENLPFQTKDGRTIWVEFVSNAYDVSGNQVIQCNIRNITERKKAEKAIIESEEKYRNLIDQAFDNIIIYTPALIILDCNQRACSTLGYSRKELKEQSVTGLFFKEDILTRPLNFETLKTGQRTLDYRRVKRKNGSGVEMEIGTSMMPDGNLMAIARDITERKKAEQKIIQSETNLRTIFENTSEGFLLMDKNAVVIAFNSKATTYAFFSDAKEFQIGQSIYDFIEGSRQEFVQNIIAKVLNGESMQYDRSYELKNGATAWIDFSATPVIEASQVKGICITGRDITEKKIIEQEREFDRNNLKALINNTNDLMWSVDSDFKLITSNDAFDEMVKAMSGKSVAKGSDVLASGFSMEELNRFRKYYERAFSGESFIEIEHIDFPDDFWSEISFYPIYHGDTIIGAACFSRNITARKKAEENLKLLEKKILEQKIQEQKEIARAIIKAQEKERNHIGQELHDNINQILAGIKLHLSMAGRDEKLKELIKYPIELLDSTIHEIRLLSSKLVTPLKNINLKELIELLLADLGKNLEVVWSFEYSLSDIFISDDLKLNIYRIIQEQLNNIVKHAAAKKVSISIQAGNGLISIVVADDGKGFDVSKKRKGIGISNMMDRVESFNGEMAIESSPGNGCKIDLKIPY